MPPAKEKKQKSQSSVPCEIFFACTLCGSRSRSVPQLHTHYRTAHRDMVNSNGKSKSEAKGKNLKRGDGSGTKGATSGSKNTSSPNAERDNTPESSPEGKDLPRKSDHASGSAKDDASGRRDGKSDRKRQISGSGSADVGNENASKDGGKEERRVSKRLKTGNGKTAVTADEGQEIPSKESNTVDRSDAELRKDKDEKNSGADNQKKGERSSTGSGTVKESSENGEESSSGNSSPKSDVSGGSDGSSSGGSKPNKKSGNGEKSPTGSPTSAKTGDTKKQVVEKDCVITRKQNVPLGMLKGKNNSLMVIFQHADQTKPLPEGSSFKLRNSAGEQTYLVVANVDVDIIEHHRKQTKKAK